MKKFVAILKEKRTGELSEHLLRRHVDQLRKFQAARQAAVVRHLPGQQSGDPNFDLRSFRRSDSNCEKRSLYSRRGLCRLWAKGAP